MVSVFLYITKKLSGAQKHWADFSLSSLHALFPFSSCWFMSVNIHDIYFHVLHTFSKDRHSNSEFYLSTFIHILLWVFFKKLDSLNSSCPVTSVFGRPCYSCQSDSARLLCAVLHPVKDDWIDSRSCSGNPTRLVGNADLWNLVISLWLDHKCHTQGFMSQWEENML